jgi:hypothetical protein
VLIAQSCRGLLRQADEAPPQTRCISLYRRSPGRDQALPRETNDDPEPFTWIADPDKVSLPSGAGTKC